MTENKTKPTAPRRVLGIDGGGSKTAFVLCTERGEVLARCVRGPSNAANVGLDAACAVLSDGIGECLRAGTPDAIFAGVAGRHYAELGDYLRGLCPGTAVRVDSDAVNILAAGGCETAIICGTGSVVIAARGEETLVLGGWGHLMGDPGSAYNLGRAAVRTALADEQGLAAPSAVTPLLREMLGLPDGTPVTEALRPIRERGVAFIASLARAVFDAARAGDASAAALLDAEMRDAMHEVNTARRRCGTGPKVAAAGGVLEHNRDLLLPLMRQYALPDTEFVFPALPPVGGACLRALSLLGCTPDADFARRFTE